MELIKRTKAEGTLFISGDVHYVEISRLTEPDLYPIYDVTSSGITSTWKFVTSNDNRIDGAVMENHFGLLTIQWQEILTLTSDIIDVTGAVHIKRTIQLNELRF